MDSIIRPVEQHEFGLVAISVTAFSCSRPLFAQLVLDELETYRYANDDDVAYPILDHAKTWRTQTETAT